MKSLARVWVIQELLLAYGAYLIVFQRWIPPQDLDNHAMELLLLMCFEHWSNIFVISVWLVGYISE